MVTLIQSTAFLFFAFCLLIVASVEADWIPDWLAATVFGVLLISGGTFFITSLITIWT